MNRCQIPYPPIIFVCLCLLGIAACSRPVPTVQDGLEVSLLYEARNEEGALVDANPDGEPIVFVVGAGQLQAKVEKELIGMKEGEQKTITVDSPYGPYDDEKTGLFPVSALPDGAEIGDELQMVDGLTSKIKEFRDEMVVIDLNHPLAGMEVTFRFHVTAIRQPTDDDGK